MTRSVEIRAGSDSDISKIRSLYDRLDSLGVSYAPRVLSAHRTPALTSAKTRALETEGFQVCIAVAGGAAHLAGVTASETVLPVIGIPVDTHHLRGLDSLYSVIQMPDGVPVGSVGIGQAESAAWVAARMVGLGDRGLRVRIRSSMGLGGPVSPEIGSKPLIGILKPAGLRLPEKPHREALALLDQFGIGVSESETPAGGEDRVRERVRALEGEGAKAIIALGDWSDDRRRTDFPGRVAEQTDLPVIGVPVMEQKLGPHGGPSENPLCKLLCSYDEGENARGYPLTGMGINRIKNAAIYAAQILGIHHPDIQQAVRKHRSRMVAETERKNERLGELGVKSYLAQEHA